jgi:hypothetical protein
MLYTHAGKHRRPIRTIVDHVDNMRAVINECKQDHSRACASGSTSSETHLKSLDGFTLDALKAKTRLGKGGCWLWTDTRNSMLYRLRDGRSDFEEGPNRFPGSELRDGQYNAPGVRHVALHQAGNRL